MLPLLRQAAARTRAAGVRHLSATTHYDYFVIGGGSGGIASARRAAMHGAKVGLAEVSQLGGTCVNVGCVPKKVMYNAANIAATFKDAAGYGFTDLGSPRVDWGLLKQRRDAYVQRLNGIYMRNLEASGVKLHHGFARFVGEKQVEVAGQIITADHILLAPGGHPIMPSSVAGIEHALTSDGFFQLADLPRRVAVVGAGYIAVELAVLRSFDHDLSALVTSSYEESGIRLYRHTHLARIDKHASGTMSLTTTDGLTVPDFDAVIVAVGRAPSVKGLHLPAGVRLQRTGHVQVDALQRTSLPGLYAVGDVCGKAELTPVAIAAGRRLADRLFLSKEDALIDYEDIPSVVFSHPPIATVGMTESQAVARYGKDAVRVYRSNFVNMYYGVCDKKEKSMFKLVCAGEERRVVGVHLFGMGVDEAMQGFAVAVKMGATKADLDKCIAIHPTAAEELVTMAPWGL